MSKCILVRRDCAECVEVKKKQKEIPGKLKATRVLVVGAQFLFWSKTVVFFFFVFNLRSLTNIEFRKVADE